jgi:hypothetical protein
MKEQGRLFDSETDIGRPYNGLPLSFLYIVLAFLFSVIGFLGYMLWDFGIAGRVILFLVLILVIIHCAIYFAKLIFDEFRFRR